MKQKSFYSLLLAGVMTLAAILFLVARKRDTAEIHDRTHRHQLHRLVVDASDLT